MAKRSQDHIQLADQHLAGQSDSQLKQKKQKLNGESVSDNAPKEPTKEERKEKKRRRKLEKGSKLSKGSTDINVPEAPFGDLKAASPAAPSAAVTSNNHESTRGGENGDKVNGRKDPANKALAKVARKEAKRKDKTRSSATEDEGKAVRKRGENSGRKKEREQSEQGVSESYYEDPALSALAQDNVDAFLSSSAISTRDPRSTAPLRPIFEFSYLPRHINPSPSSFASFKSPTPIQAAAWPFLLSGRDVVGVAETGSGKTFAFGLPLIHHLKSMVTDQKSTRSVVRAVVVSPTRELASQIYDQICLLATPAGLGCSCLYGGVPKDDQRAALKKAQIIVATPGRLNDLIEEGAADLSQVRYLVLDEADRMLDKGFEDAIRQILSNTPPPSAGRQTLMFTATWPPSVRDLASTFMKDPVHIANGRDNPTGELRANIRIEQRVEVVDPREKETRLLQLIKEHNRKVNPKSRTTSTASSSSSFSSSCRILIFALYKKEASRLHSLLLRHSLPSVSIHGDMPQPARTASLSAFRSGSKPLLVATDVAARGLDIPNVSLVINVTFPLTAEDYVHRIGRTGRAGKDGLAITLFTEHDKANSGALINVLKAAGQEVPEELLKFGGTVKKKGHEVYGNFYRDVGGAGGGKTVGKKFRFD